MRAEVSTGQGGKRKPRRLTPGDRAAPRIETGSDEAAPEKGPERQRDRDRRGKLRHMDEKGHQQHAADSRAADGDADHGTGDAQYHERGKVQRLLSVQISFAVRGRTQQASYAASELAAPHKIRTMRP
jgi:hypothetical protein